MAKADSLERDIKIKNIQLKRLQDELKPKLEELQRLRNDIKALGS